MRRRRVKRVSSKFLLAGHSPGTVAHAPWPHFKSILSPLAAHGDGARGQGDKRESLQFLTLQEPQTVRSSSAAAAPRVPTQMLSKADCFSRYPNRGSPHT